MLKFELRVTRPRVGLRRENSTTIFTVWVTIRIYGVYLRTKKLIQGGENEKSTR